MSSCLKQNDPRWGTVTLGEGPSSIGRSGCVLTALTEAACRWGKRPDYTPVIVNELAREAGCFDHDRLVVREAAPIFGLDAPHGEYVASKAGDPALRTAIEKAIAAGGGAILRIDHVGDGKGRHSILAVEFAAPTPKRVLCCDSAPAQVIALSWPELEAKVMWRKVEKTYRVVAVQPIRKLRPTA